MGLYNCLPFGVLDGARLLALMVPAQGLPALARIRLADEANCKMLINADFEGGNAN